MNPSSLPLAPNPEHGVPRLAYCVEDAAIALSIGRTRVWQLIREGHLNAIRIGGRTLISVAELADFVARGGTK